MKVLANVYWDKGMREENQDSILYEQVRTRKGRVVLTAVSDGIGGLSEGETASGYILEKLLQSFYEEILPCILRGRGKKSMKRSFLRCFYETNRILNQYADSKNIRLGATVSVLLLYGRHFMTIHLGDSRIYQITEKAALQLTRDHIRKDKALEKCMGSFPYQSPDFQEGMVRKNMGFLLCSDGYYHTLDTRMLQQLFRAEELSEEQIAKRLKELALRALKNGECDNLSAIYVGMV